MIFYECRNAVQLHAAEILAVLKPYRSKPEFGLAVFALYVHMRWLVAVPCVEEEPIWTTAQDRGHRGFWDESDQAILA